MKLLASFYDVPGYNYWFEACSLIFLIVLSIRFFTGKKFPNAITFIFGFALVAAMCDLGLDIIGSILIDRIEIVPRWSLELVNGAFYIFQIVFPALMFSYIIYLSGRSYSDRRFLLLLLPACIFIIVQCLNPAMHWVFAIEEGNNGLLEYVHKPMFNLYYPAAGFYILGSLIYIIVNRKRMEPNQRFTLYWFLACIVIFIVLQNIFPTILFTGTGITIAISIAMYQIENPTNMLDSVTGVFNFNAMINFANSAGNIGKRKFVILLSLDSISPINETYGLSAGNKVYKQIGDFFNSISKKVWVFRIFNSKFIFVFDDEVSQQKSITALAERFLSPWTVDGHDFELKCKIFYYTYQETFDSIEDFLTFADVVYKDYDDYKDKNVIRIENSYFEKLERRKVIAEVVDNALEYDLGLSLNYQPIYDMATHKFNKVEALLRLQDTRLGHVSPAEFVPIAENAGLASKLDEYVISQACIFLNKYPEIENLEVNISGAEFFQNPARKFIKLIKGYNVDPKRITFEVTETAAIEYPEKISAFMAQMTAEGFTFAVDDFGTGYSNFAQIINKPFSLIKIDRSMLVEDPRIKIFLKGMVSLFKRSKIPMVIEGVETKEILEEMKRLEIEYVQGYYFSKPLPEEEFIKFIKSHKNPA